MPPKREANRKPALNVYELELFRIAVRLDGAVRYWERMKSKNIEVDAKWMKEGMGEELVSQINHSGHAISLSMSTRTALWMSS